jgi:hypothetical protein
MVDLPQTAKRLLQEVSAAPTQADALDAIRKFNRNQLTDAQLEALGEALTDLLRELPR